MIDTVGFHSYINNPYILLKNIEGIKEFPNTNTGLISYSGNLENLRIYIKDNHFSIIGSLPKYYFGNNFNELNKAETKQTIEKISDSLKVKINESDIYRLDIGSNLTMSNPVIDYLQTLVYLNRFSYSYIKGSIYFERAKLKLLFYNKNKEHLRKKNKLPNELVNKNLLRYEMSFLNSKEIKKHIPKGLIIKNLTSKQVNNKMIELWTNYYFQIIKREKNMRINFNELKSIKDLKDICTSSKINEIGEVELLEKLESQRKELSPMQFNRLKKGILRIIQKRELSDNSLIKEFDNKIIEARTMFYS